MNNSKKSPLKERPLHVAGQSLDEKIQNHILEELPMLFFVPGLFIILTIEIWVILAHPIKYLPIIMLAMTVVAIICCAVRFIILRKKIKSLALGRKGERIVAEIFDNFRSLGFIVFHDIVAGNFNIDHVILTTHGIFTVETKTFSKPPKGEITYKDEKIIAGNINTGNEIILQAESQTKWLKSMLKDSTGRDYHLMPVIVFPGWFVQPMPENLKRRIWILNPEVLDSFIKNEPIRIQESDIHLAAFHISRYIRMYN
jgi:hypothetical protein